MSSSVWLILVTIWLIGALTIGKLLANACVSVWENSYNNELKRPLPYRRVNINSRDVVLSVFLFPISLMNRFIFDDSGSETLGNSRFPPIIGSDRGAALINDITNYKIIIAFTWPIRIMIIPVNMVLAVFYIPVRYIVVGIYWYFE